jgi:hypothetical protein
MRQQAAAKRQVKNKNKHNKNRQQAGGTREETALIQTKREVQRNVQVGTHFTVGKSRSYIISE